MFLLSPHQCQFLLKRRQFQFQSKNISLSAQGDSEGFFFEITCCYEVVFFISTESTEEVARKQRLHYSFSLFCYIRKRQASRTLCIFFMNLDVGTTCYVQEKIKTVTVWSNFDIGRNELSQMSFSIYFNNVSHCSTIIVKRLGLLRTLLHEQQL